MQVTQLMDHVTHAVIGGKKTIDFGISDDPAFFQILSKSLYKHPVLAMIRETICNAWDSHIESEQTHKAINITLGDDYLTIQDFGLGIPDALIGPIYGVYGASTKKNDKRSTGGFGLGCKSPFAYTDHFEVTSCHESVKTIYNMSRSSAAVDGKPGIVPIASFPTTESGITVKIPLSRDTYQLDGLIRQVVYNGDIKATLNLLELPVLGLDTSEHGLVMVPQHTNVREASHLTDTLIQIRYGNVIYPVESNDEYATLYSKVVNLLRNHYSCSLVMMAPADSISVTPSRESLTSSDITVSTLNSLLGKFLSIFLKNQQLLFRHKEMINEYVDKAATVESPLQDKLPGIWHIPGIPHSTEDTLLSSTEDFAKMEVLLRYSKNNVSKISSKKWLKYIQRYFYKINESNVFDRGMFQSWARTFQRNLKKVTNPARGSYGTDRESSLATVWWAKQVLAPLVHNLLVAVPKFNKAKLYFFSSTVNTGSYYDKPILVSNIRIRHHTSNLIHLLTPVVVLAHNATLLQSRITNLSQTEQASIPFLNKTYFIYEVGRKREELAEIQEAFKNVPGINFLDLTGRTASEQRDYEDRRAILAKERAEIAAGRVPKTRLVKKVKPGIFRLDGLIDDTHQRINTLKFTETLDPERIIKPEAVMLISCAKDKRHEASVYFNSKLSYAIAKLYGENVGITNRRDTVERHIEGGAVNIDDYVFDKIMHDVEHSPSLQEYYTSDILKVMAYIDVKVERTRRSETSELVNMLLTYPELAHLVPDVQSLSDEDKYRWTLWQNISTFGNYSNRGIIEALQDKIRAIPLKPEIVEFLDKLLANPFLGLIDVYETSQLMRRTKDPIEQAKLVALITTILT